MKEHLGVPSLHWCLANLKKNNFHPAVVYDIGAYEGFWTKDFKEVFPSAKMYMFEAQEKKRPFLQSLKKSMPQVEFQIALLSAADGDEVYFNEDETASFVHRSINSTDSKRITVALDSIIRENNYPYPNLMKLDVQGHELEVLKGGSRALEHAEVCILEITILDLGNNNPLLLDVLNFMDQRNFVAYDISQFIRRPLDKALFQMDMFFVKRDSALIKNKNWS